MQKGKFATDGYNVSIIGKNVQVTDAIRNYVLEKTGKIERFTNKILDVTVTLDVQKITHTVSIGMKFLHYRIEVHASTNDMYSAIDKATEKLMKLICKYHNKLKDHHQKEFISQEVKVQILQSRGNEVDVINDEIEEENLKEESAVYKFHEVVDKETMLLKNLTQEEAIMKLELGGLNFLVYRGEEDKKIKVIYRRKDDRLGIIQVE